MDLVIDSSHQITEEDAVTISFSHFGKLAIVVLAFPTSSVVNWVVPSPVQRHRSLNRQYLRSVVSGDRVFEDVAS